MDENLPELIENAAELIRSGKLDAARAILLQVLRQDERIEQAWFLLSYTLPQGDKQDFALNQALRINPEFDRARDRLDQIQGDIGHKQPSIEENTEVISDEVQETDSISDLESELPAKEIEANEEPQFPQETFLEGEKFEEEIEKKGISRRTWALVGLIILLLIILVIAAFPGILSDLIGLDQPDIEPTVVQGFRTLPPTWTP